MKLVGISGKIPINFPREVIMSSSVFRSARRVGAVFLLAGLCLVPAFSATAWNPDPSQPVAAIFYPDEVQVTVEENLAPETLPSGGTGFLLAIPAGVRPDTFLLSIDGVPGGGHYWLPREERDAALAARRNQPVPGQGTLPENEPSPERRALLEKLVVLAEEFSRAEGELAGAEARLTLWRRSLNRFEQDRASGSGGTPGQTPSIADEAAKLDASYKQQYAALYLERERHGRVLADVGRRLQEAKKDLSEFDRRAGCELVAVPFAGQARAALALRYTYVLPASCRFSYRLTAYPDRDEITVAQDATLFQQSGFPWQKTDLYLSTLRRDRELKPRNISPWQIALESRDKPSPVPAPGKNLHLAKQVPSRAMQAATAQESLADFADEENAGAASPREPVQEERSTFRLWSLGRQRVEHKIPVRLPLSSDNYKAKFLYTLRPISNPKGFLTADVNLPQALELPPGMAQFAVDDAVLGDQMFSFNGNKGTIFFGSDPQVTAVMRDLKRSSGEEGFFNKEETRSWHWRITLKSTRAKPVDAWLEDPVPDTRSEAIKITVESSPKPEESVNPPEDGGARIYRWKTVLKPGEPQVIEHKVRAATTLSKELELSPGR